MFQLRHVKARVARLDEMVRGLAKEICIVKAADDPLLYLERKAYLAALRRAVAGLDDARVVLARAVTRMKSVVAPGGAGRAPRTNRL